MAARETERVVGVVKFFDVARHFGFIRHPDGREFYLSSLSAAELGYAPKKGERLSFVPGTSSNGNGLRADHVRRVEAPF